MLEEIKSVIGKYMNVLGVDYIVNYDEARNKLQIGTATNNSFLVHKEITYDNEFSLDNNLMALYNEATYPLF